MNAVGITENVKGDHRKFEIWYSGREEVYVVQVCPSESVGRKCVSLISLLYNCHCALPGSNGNHQF